MTHFRIDVWPTGASDLRHLDSRDSLRVDLRLVEGRVYFLRGGTLKLDQVERLCREVLSDPVTEKFAIDHLPVQSLPMGLTIADNSPMGNGQSPIVNHFIDVTLLPGVTDSVAENLLRAAHVLGIETLEAAASGQRVQILSKYSPEQLHQLALDRYANPVIQRFTIDVPITPPFVNENEDQGQVASDQVETVSLMEANAAKLLAISKDRRLSLDLAEMQAIQTYYRGDGREPTDIELEMLAQTWSEHCVHKTFKAIIDIDDGGRRTEDGNVPVTHLPSSVNGLLKSYIRAATEKLNKPWVKSAFVDNAGIIEFDEHWDLAFKVETHNHPSALEPFGGANTGLGGVIRDVLGVSARPIANTDVLCFGPIEDDGERKTEDDNLPALRRSSSVLPSGVLPPKRVYDGVIHGIEDYGNKMGIPTVNGAIYFHPGYTANPLVFAGCVGVLPRRETENGRRATDVLPASPQPGDLIIAIGGRTGRDGLRGATFSSMEMDTTTSQIAGSAVQIGHPIHEKQAQEAILQAHALGLYHAITDCGAGGFSSAVGEMASGLGASVQLQHALLKYPGLQPWEIWLSEAQERMVLAVPPEHWPQLKALCDGQDIDAFSLGTFEASGRLKLLYGDRTVGDISIEFLHEGIPQRRLRAVVGGLEPSENSNPQTFEPSNPPNPPNLINSLLQLLSHPNIRSREDVIRKYDHEVKGQTAVKPLVGIANAGPSDASVLAIARPTSVVRGPSSVVKGVALSNGLCPQYGELDPYAMAWAAIDEAVRNAVAVGADPDRIAILDNFCWGNPNLPDRLGSLVECARGCHDAALAYGTPFISGKDSLNNEYTDTKGQKHAIPGTLLISALGIVPDVNRTATMDLKQAGDFLFVIGETRGEMGGSHYALSVGREVWGDDIRSAPHVPCPIADPLPRLRALHKAIAQGWVAACHDCSEGGLAVALAEMCLAGRLGAELKLANLPVDRVGLPEILLFCESLGRFIVEIKPEHVADFEALMQANTVPCAEVGRVWDDDVLRIYSPDGTAVVWAEVAQLEQAFRGHLPLSIDHLPVQSLPVGLTIVKQTQLIVNDKWSMDNQKKRVLILHANGSNRDHDAAAAIALAGGEPEIVHVNQLSKHERNLLDYHMLLIPGGFTYGDDLGSGMLWALDLRERFGADLDKFIASGRPVLGICNGFQALVKAGVFEGRSEAFEGSKVRRFESSSEPSKPYTLSKPSNSSNLRSHTLTFNQSHHFECRWVYLQANANSACVFTQGIDEPIYCPVAHGEGRFMVRDEMALAQLQSSNRVALTYVGEGYPANPNGSMANIAGISNAAGNVLGLMPHPENHIFYWQHPRWHRGERGLTGLQLFENGIRHA